MLYLFKGMPNAWSSYPLFIMQFSNENLPLSPDNRWSPIPPDHWLSPVNPCLDAVSHHSQHLVVSLCSWLLISLSFLAIDCFHHSWPRYCFPWSWLLSVSHHFWQLTVSFTHNNIVSHGPGPLTVFIVPDCWNGMKKAYYGKICKQAACLKCVPLDFVD